MGIPAFYRWLVEKFPLSVVDVIQEVPTAVKVPIDTSKPNPNGVEFDNLYLDMNGIIHPCFHPEDGLAPKTFEEVFIAIFYYIDHIFSMIRPRKLMFMAIDGIAPRAKMNQQRSRRFRAARDAAEAAAEEEKLRGKFKSEGEKLTLSGQANKLDSNVITPGTEFMESVSLALQYYIHLRLNKDPGWREIKVILSDANVPGEGEHKVAAYIRLQRNLPGFDPNTRHCLYGLDADLIMLGLATHEIHFSILREDVRTQRKENSTKSAHWNQVTAHKGGRKELIEGANNDITKMHFQFINIWTLREYLEHDMRIPGSKMKLDLERLIDDFVFICLFVGNDFLPHVPSLEISEGAIDLLMTVYRKEFISMGGYLTNSSEVDLERVEQFLQVVGSHENAIFRRRGQVHKEREKYQFGKTWANSSNAVVDEVKLGKEGWKERYYAEKFNVKTENDLEELKKHAVMKYAEGICWVMHYYYQGVCSWQWFYPYHYAPFASDFHGLQKLDIQFTLGVPFKPFDQLMGVLPAASAHALPLFYRNLMTDLSSPVADFYPTDFELDMNGKRFSWQAICKLPFIEESRLLAEIKKVEHTLTAEEKQRNCSALDRLFVHISHPLAAKIFSFYMRKSGHSKLSRAKVKRKINPKFSSGMNGYMYVSEKTVCLPEIYSPIGGMETITENKTIFVFYRCPPIHTHIPTLPEGVILPPKSISKRDVVPMSMLWHEKSAILGRKFSETPVPRSVSGSHLSMLARQLISKHYLVEKQQNTTDSVEHAVDGSSFGMEEPLRKRVKKRKRLNAAQKEVKQKEMNHTISSQNPGPGKRKRNVTECDVEKLKKEVMVL